MIDADAAGDTYTGDFNSTTHWPVVGVSLNWVGNWVGRTSAFSNAIDGIQVAAVSQTIWATNGFSGWKIDPMVESYQAW